MMAEEYIRREDAIKAFDLNDYMFYPFEAQNIIRAIPSADVAPVKENSFSDCIPSICSDCENKQKIIESGYMCLLCKKVKKS